MEEMMEYIKTPTMTGWHFALLMFFQIAEQKT